MKLSNSLSVVALALVQSAMLVQAYTPTIFPGEFRPDRDAAQYEMCRAANSKKVVRSRSFSSAVPVVNAHTILPTLVRRHKIWKRLYEDFGVRGMHSNFEERSQDKQFRVLSAGDLLSLRVST